MLTATLVVKKNRIPGMDGRLRQADRDIRIKGAEDMYAGSLPTTPVDTGLLRGNVVRDETGVYWLQDYAAHQNFGTVRGVPANHFAETGFNVGYPGMIAAYQDLERQLV